MNTMKAIAWACVLLVIVLLFWSVLAVQVIYPFSLKVEESGGYDGCSRCSRAFSSVWASFVTLLQTTVAGDSWGQTAVPMIEAYPWTAVFFIAVLTSMVLGMMNLVLMVIVDRAHELRDIDAQKKSRKKFEKMRKARSSILGILETLDEDKSGSLSHAELLGGYDQDKDLRARLIEMGISRKDLSDAFEQMRPANTGDVCYIDMIDHLQQKHYDARAMIQVLRSDLVHIQREIHEDLDQQLATQAEKTDQFIAMLKDMFVPSRSERRAKPIQTSAESYTVFAEKTRDEDIMGEDVADEAVTVRAHMSENKGFFRKVMHPCTSREAVEVSKDSNLEDILTF